MMTPRDIDRIWALVPRANPQYRAVFDLAESVLPRFGLTTQRRTAHFVAQVLHETGGFRKIEEDLNYTAKRLTEVWPRRFRTIGEAEPYAGNPRHLANFVYRNRNGNVDEEDGWVFRGRGLIQITGRFNYTRVGRILGLDLAHEPELVTQPAYALEVAGCMWHLLGCNPFADRDDIVAVTKAINGGDHGLDDRTAWLVKVKRALNVGV